MKKVRDDFQFPFVPLIGANHTTLRKISKTFRVDPSFRRRFRLSWLVSMVLAPFRATERWATARKVNRFKPEADPVFIIGHWRSGTTFLHNLLSHDSRFGFCSTYQSLFPDLTLVHQFWLAPLIGKIMPSHRPADHAALDLSFPQEEEFALGNLVPWCFYFPWYYPNQFNSVLDQHAAGTFDDGKLRAQWKTEYIRFIKIALINTRGKIYLSKNPPNTLRLNLLMEIFPKAKFIFITRNPYEVFESLKRFVRGVLPTTQLQECNLELMDEHLTRLMDVFFNRYEETRPLLKPGTLIEITYENLMKDPLKVTEEIYQALDLGGHEDVRPALNRYVNESSEFKPASYRFSDQTILRVNSVWKSLFDRMGYTRLVAAVPNPEYPVVG